MEIFQVSDIFFFDIPFSSCVVTLGDFDGIHIAHQEILHKVVALSKKYNVVSVAITYFPSLKEFLRTEATDRVPLLTFEEKKEQISKCGIDYLIVIRTTQEFLRISAFSFLHRFLRTKLNMKHLVIGYDHTFGFRRRGEYYYLSSASRKYSFGFTRVECSFIAKHKVSSTRIRKLLGDGDVSTVSQMLKSYFFVSGMVVRGEQIGHKLNFPTVNLEVSINKLLPCPGVYITCIIIEGVSNLQYGVTNIGFCPTMKDQGRVFSIETFILDFCREVYNLGAKIYFIQRLRDEKKFNSPEELQNEIKQDVQKAERYFSFPLEFNIISTR